MRKEIIGSAELYLGDAASILAQVPEFDALICDPPYGVNRGSGTLGKASSKTKYASDFEDSPENVMNVVIPIIRSSLIRAKRGVITPGTPCCFMYPPPQDMGALYQPATIGLNKWGRETTQPVLFYGKDPRAGKTIQNKHFTNNFRSEDNGHPCPKPIEVMRWMVDRGSLDGETVFDPFMGSGTTGVACMELGRKFIGIDIDERYFDIACRRIEQSQRQGRLIA